MSQCIPFKGQASHYQNEALGLYLHVEQVVLQQFSWAVWTCTTDFCLNVNHLEVKNPQWLNYPSGVCVYCGLTANTQDHLMPQPWTGSGHRGSVFTVPACGQCNSAIGSRLAFNITERRAIAQAHLRKKYAKVLRRPEWTQDQLDEFEGHLRAAVIAGLQEKQLLLDRLSWPPAHFDERAIEHTGVNPYECGLLVPEGSSWT